MDVVEADSLRAKGMGFAGKAAIHPNQLKPVNAVFRTSPEDLATARESLAAFEAAGGGALRSGGQMIDAALLRRQRMLLEVASLTPAMNGSDERRVGKEGFIKFRSVCSPIH